MTHSHQEAPNIEREELLRKLENIPTEVLRGILSNQVDLEIRLKHKELSLTEEEIGKCEAQMLALRKFLEVPNEISFRNEPSDFTVKYYNILNEQLSVNFTRLQQQQYQQQPVLKESIFDEPASSHSYRTRSTTSSLRPSIVGASSAISGCLYRRTDGVVVKLTCSDCHRSNFSSAQGFLNHNRIAHSKEFTSQDAAALSCGEALSEELQDEEGLASIQALRQKGLDASKHLNSMDLIYRPDGEREKEKGPAERPDKATDRLDRRAPAHEKRERKASVLERRGSFRRSTSAERNERKRDELSSPELMKKLISQGITQDADTYRAMVQDLRTEVPNSHLFEGEKEVEDEKPDEVTRAEKPDSAKRPELGGKYENRLRRRKSRTDDDDDRKRRR